MKGHLFYWRGQSALGGPAVSVDTSLDCSELDPNTLRPFGHAKRFPVVGQPSIVALISALLLLCGPPAVPRLVVPIIVDAVDGCLWRLRPHVSTEGFKVVQPSVAHTNSATTIASIVGIRRVIASGFHSLPCGVFTTVGHAVGGISPSCRVCLQASARLGVSILEVAVLDDCRMPALACAIPISTIVPAGGFVNNCEPAKSLARQVGIHQPAATGLTASNEQRRVSDKLLSATLALAKQVAACASIFTFSNHGPIAKSFVGVHADIIATHTQQVQVVS